MDPEVVDWVISNFLPFEADLRAILRRFCGSPSEMDDVIQEVYYKVLKMDSVAHIRDPKAFLVQVSKNTITDRLRRDSVISIDAMSNLEDLEVEDVTPSPERVAMARSELKWVIGLIANLPERCKDVFSARRIYGLSQAETAKTLGITEGIVEQEIKKGLHLIADMIARVSAHGEPVPKSIQKLLSKTKNVNN
jgi:RNA polymerase sigma-70 factor (ECF subfamily)